MRTLTILLFAGLAGCGMDAPSAISTAALSHGNPNPALFPEDSHPYGHSMERWGELMWSFIYKIPMAQNPLLDPTGADCAVGQDEDGPVWFLPSVPGASLGTSVTRSCTIPRHRGILLQLASTLNDYPCPDPTFQPPPGETLYQFLIQPLIPLINGVTDLHVTLDGVALNDVLSYRSTSDDLFHFTGDVSMQAFDNCVTGKPQPGVIDGFFLMFKPLSPGAHTIVATGHDVAGVALTFTENLTIQ
jgi:hypothetical protein